MLMKGKREQCEFQIQKQKIIIDKSEDVRQHRLQERQFLLDMMPKKSICAEIGVLHGDFADCIIKKVKPKRLHLIDSWRVYQLCKDNIVSSEYANVEREFRLYCRCIDFNKSIAEILEDIHKSVLKRFRTAIKTHKVIVHRNLSINVCQLFSNNYFDWIYIDGNHDYTFVKQDLELYFRKVKPNGFIAGDDYTIRSNWQSGYGDVKKAVDEFVEKWPVKVVIIEKHQYILQKI